MNYLALSKLSLLIVIAMLSIGCGHKRKAAKVRTPQPKSSKQRAQTAKPVAIGTKEEGIASWYGVPYHGRPAANGEIYDMETLVAAHRTMPFETWLRVTNLSNHDSVDVRVIDRGPFVDGRIIDLSKAAARKIKLIGPGIGRVRLEVISSPRDVPSNDFYSVQVGAFTVLSNAERARDRYASLYGSAHIAVRESPRPMWRVLVGQELTPEAAQKLAQAIGERETGNFFVVRLDLRSPEIIPEHRSSSQRSSGAVDRQAAAVR